jgi:hypothetical protein
VELFNYLRRVLLVNLGYVATRLQCFLQCKVFEAALVFGIKSLDVAEIEFPSGLRIRQCFVAFPLLSQKLLLNLRPQHRRLTYVADMVGYELNDCYGREYGKNKH